jgi:hypothetical protein
MVGVCVKKARKTQAFWVETVTSATRQCHKEHNGQAVSGVAAGDKEEMDNERSDGPRRLKLEEKPDPPRLKGQTG